MDTVGSHQTQIELIIDASTLTTNPTLTQTQIQIQTQTQTQELSLSIFIPQKRSFSWILTRIHAGYFRITLSFCSQALLWQTIHTTLSLPSSAFIFLWSLSLFTLTTLSLLYIMRCFFHFHMVKSEFLHHIGVNYLFAPWTSWLLLLQSSPFIAPKTNYYLVLWWLFVVPIVILDVKIYGQWFTKGKRFLSMVANPTSQISVIANLVGARAAAQMGWRESAMCFFSLGITHYLVVFVTLYQRLSGCDRLPTMLRPVFFLFIAAPSMASLAWDSVSGSFGIGSKLLFFLSFFLFASLVCRPTLFRKSMRRFNVAWWAYSFPLTVLAMASTEYAREVKGGVAHVIMLMLLALSVLVFLGLILFTIINTRTLLSDNDPILSSTVPPINVKLHE